MTREHARILLGIDEIPKNFVNILPHLEQPLPPPLNPATNEPIEAEALMAIFPKECVMQEMCQDKTVSIPSEVREAFARFGRPTPIQRAFGLEAALKTTARIYYKREDVSPTGSHKLNTALTQSYFAAKEGVERYATETGAGQWGSAVSLASAYFGLQAMVYMVRISYQQKSYRGTMMRVYGADVVPSPSDRTKFGRSLLKEDPDHPGSLGIAITEALEDAMSREDTKYTLGSVLNHVLLHQTVIGQEAIMQMEIAEETPDYIVGCVGGGSNFAGLSFPFMIDERYKETKFIAVEPEACPTLSKGEYRYDFGDTGGMTPKLKMHTLGANFIPPKIHAGGLRYHGVAPVISALTLEGRIQPKAYDQVEVLDAGMLFAQTEGIIPAPETAHAIKATIDLATQAKRRGEEQVILFNFSGHGHFDMTAYSSLMDGTLESSSPDFTGATLSSEVTKA
ncbi:MAG: TrpB-like pyridoxal phosphate-dependent enzyme [Candidatus Thorarchaeota archaeon]|nr:TrpB-like pyridoxal phosphate-dependent enzyme [Candidatus Thorarchaeota archaeon]